MNTTTEADSQAGAGQVERRVRPVAWLREQRDEYEGSATLAPLLILGASEVRPHSALHGATYEPLYNQAAIEATADDAASLAREAEAHYWRSMVERLTAQADAWNARYMALVQQVADGRAMQPTPAIAVGLGPNARVSGPQQAAQE